MLQQADHTLNVLDMNCEKEKLAIGGNDGKIHIYECNNPEAEPDFLNFPINFGSRTWYGFTSTLEKIIRTPFRSF